MMRAIVVASFFAFACSTAALASDTAPQGHDAKVVKVAKGPAKGGKGAGKDKGAKAPEKAVPEGARVDPRASQPEAAPAAAPAVGGEARRGMSRIEFDDRLVQGQTNKANAIYLFERRESSLRSLLKKRSDFHDEIDETLE